MEDPHAHEEWSRKADFFRRRSDGRALTVEKRGDGVWIALLDHGQVVGSVLVTSDEFRALLEELPVALAGDLFEGEVAT